MKKIKHILQLVLLINLISCEETNKNICTFGIEKNQIDYGFFRQNIKFNCDDSLYSFRDDQFRNVPFNFIFYNDTVSQYFYFNSFKYQLIAYNYLDRKIKKKLTFKNTSNEEIVYTIKKLDTLVVFNTKQNIFIITPNLEKQFDVIRYLIKIKKINLARFDFEVIKMSLLRDSLFVSLDITSQNKSIKLRLNENIKLKFLESDSISLKNHMRLPDNYYIAIPQLYNYKYLYDTLIIN